MEKSVTESEGADGGSGVLVFSPRGEKLQPFGSRGSGQGQFYSPYREASDGSGGGGGGQQGKFPPAHLFYIIHCKCTYLKALGTLLIASLNFSEFSDNHNRPSQIQ